MSIDELRQALNEGIVRFEFRKKDGTLRYARGTTNPDIISSEDMPKGKRTAQQKAVYDSQTVAFYDIDKKGWRSMRIDTIWDTHKSLKLSE